MNKIKVLIIIFCILFLGGCTHDVNSKIEPIKIGIFPIDASDETYLLNLKQNGELEVLFGERKNNYIGNNGFIKDVGRKISDDIESNDFISANIKKKKKLSDRDIEEITNIYQSFTENEVTDINSLYTGANWVVTVIINNKVYAFYYSDRSMDDTIRKLVDQLIKCSPLEVRKPNRY